MNRHERRVAARKSQSVPGGAGARTPASLTDSALAHMQAGRHREAIGCCQQALAIDPRHVGGLHLMGLLSLQARQYDAAIEWTARANREDPKTDYVLSLGTALEQQGLHEEALKAFDKAAQLKPDDAESRARLANVLVQLKRPADAILNADHALRLDPGLAYAFHVRGRALETLKRFDESLADSRQACALDPDNAAMSVNVGYALMLLGRYEEALPWFDRALQLQPDHVTALINKAQSLTQIRRFDEAFAIYDQVKAIDPDNVDVQWNLSLVHLLLGDFEAGWAEREVRWRRPQLSGTALYPKFTQPMWLGEGDIDGKTVLIYADEGFGDTLQFARYLPMLAARGARVILVVDGPLYPLFSQMSGVSQCISKLSGKLPAFDVHCPICSLPLVFKTRLDNIPPSASYLPRPADGRVQAWQDRLGAHDRLRVGLVWSGNPAHADDRNRSIPLRALAPLLELDARFVSLQKDLRATDKAVLDQCADLIDLTAHLADFAETAALISCLDLVITVDTSVAHLSATLDRPTWILLPYRPDFRWLLDRDDSPWYPTVRLFRQTAPRDWTTVIGRVREALIELVETRS
jgi:tetratricopeptide (TPR) repeat protein/ADP-heptose:LPS heptosyltransferase